MTRLFLGTLLLLAAPSLAHAKIGGSEGPGVELYSATTGLEEDRYQALQIEEKPKVAPSKRPVRPILELGSGAKKTALPVRGN